ncbi:MAG: hypothetical protein HY064_07335 [Bacteroidetes bacterium]|nr:hypothetical protein [Bacteroidota bacterium]
MKPGNIQNRMLLIFAISLIICAIILFLFSLDFGGMETLVTYGIIVAILFSLIVNSYRKHRGDFDVTAIPLLPFIFIYYTWRWIVHRHIDFHYTGSWVDGLRAGVVPIIYVIKWIMSLITFVVILLFQNADEKN